MFKKLECFFSSGCVQQFVNFRRCFSILFGIMLIFDNFVMFLISIVTNKLTKRPFDDNKYLTVLYCY